MMKIFATALLLLFALPCVAADKGRAIPWESLNEYERQVLIELRGEWDDFSPERQAQLQRGAERWLKHTIDRRRLSHREYRRWQRTPREERARARKRFEEFQQLSEKEKARIRQAQEEFRAMSAEERRALRERWESLPEDERQKFMEMRRYRSHPPSPRRPHPPRRWDVEEERGKAKEEVAEPAGPEEPPAAQ